MPQPRTWTKRVEGAGLYLWVADWWGGVVQGTSLRNSHAMEDLLGPEVCGTICRDR